MSSTRWDPWSDVSALREAMSSLAESGYRRESIPSGGPLGLSVDVYESTTAFVVIASVPGVHQDDVSITVHGDTIRISGERMDPPVDEAGGRWLRRERRFGPFDRTLRMPAEIAADDASAAFENGVLIVRLPKAQSGQPRSIPVRATSREPAIDPQSES